MGLRNLTGSKMIVEICSKLGHCINYNMTSEIETAQADKAVKLAEDVSILPLKPKFNGSN